MPGEISLALSISGCPLKCSGCHSPNERDPKYGEKLTTKKLEFLIERHRHISCVLFYGGEWELFSLIEIIQFCKSKGLKVALYSGFGLSHFEKEFINVLDYLKVGPYIEELGGISNPGTNQKFYKISNNELIDITESFQTINN